MPLAHRHMFLSMERVVEDALQDAWAEEAKVVAEAIDQAKDEGTFDPHIPTAWIAEAYDNLIYAGWSLVETGEATPKQAAAFAWRVLTKGAAA